MVIFHSYVKLPEGNSIKLMKLRKTMDEIEMAAV